MLVKVARRAPLTRAEGPGLRYALWVQGCSLRCAACASRELTDPLAGIELDTSNVLDEIGRARRQIEGITLRGGEPFDQSRALCAIASGARALGLSVMTCTAHAREAVDAEELIRHTDLLLAGPWDAAQPETRRRWAQSANQRFHFLSARYAPGIEFARPLQAEAPR